MCFQAGLPLMDIAIFCATCPRKLKIIGTLANRTQADVQAMKDKLQGMGAVKVKLDGLKGSNA